MGVRRRGGKVFRINRPPMGWDGCPHIRYMVRSIALVVVAVSPGAGATEASGRIFCGAHSSSSSSSSKTTIWGIRSGVKENPPFPPLNFVPSSLPFLPSAPTFFFGLGAPTRRNLDVDAKQDCPPPANVRPILCRPLAPGPDDNKSSNLLNLLPAKVLLHYIVAGFAVSLTFSTRPLSNPSLSGEAEEGSDRKSGGGNKKKFCFFSSSAEVVASSPFSHICLTLR